MTQIQNLYKTLKFTSNPSMLTEAQVKALMPMLLEEVTARETSRIKRLLDRSGLKPIKRLEDFDWKFNPKLPREELMRREFVFKTPRCAQDHAYSKKNTITGNGCI